MKNNLFLGFAISLLIASVAIGNSVENNVDLSLSNLVSLAKADGTESIIKYPTTSSTSSSTDKKNMNTATTRVHCTGRRIVINNSNNTGQSNTNMSGSAYINGSAMWGAYIMNGGLSGSASNSNSTSTGNQNSSYTETTSDFWAEKVYCPTNGKSDCTPYDPCAQ